MIAKFGKNASRFGRWRSAGEREGECLEYEAFAVFVRCLLNNGAWNREWDFVVTHGYVDKRMKLSEYMEIGNVLFKI